MLTLGNHAAGRRQAPVWRRSVVLSALFLMISVCHGALMGSAVAADVPAHPALAIVADEGVPAHAADCAVDIEAAAPSTLSARIAWIGQPLGEWAWRPALDRPVVGPPDSVSVGSPAVRRALLQIFLI